MNTLDSLVEKLAAEAGPVKKLPSPLQLSLSWCAAALLYLALTLWLTGPRPDLGQKLHDTWFMVELLVLIVAFGTATLSAAILAFPDLHQKRVLAWLPAPAFILLALVLAGAWLADSPPSPHPMHSIECTASITFTSVLPALWTFIPLRRYASTHAHWMGSVALLGAFSVGAIWLRLHEETDSISHLITWHYLPMLAIGLIGFWLGKRLLKW